MHGSGCINDLLSYEGKKNPQERKKKEESPSMDRIQTWCLFMKHGNDETSA